MLKPIKRVWVPPQPMPAASSTSAVAPAAKAPAVRKLVFSELPETEVEERNSDSVWAEFDSVYARANANKTSSV
jgi:hypothetical protein